jgi:hypothetical protein
MIVIGKNHVTAAELLNVATPAETDTFKPLPHHLLVLAKLSLTLALKSSRKTMLSPKKACATSADSPLVTLLFLVIVARLFAVFAMRTTSRSLLRSALETV